MNQRVFRFLDAAGISLGVDVTDNVARVALAACNDEDAFSRVVGRDILNSFFDQCDQTLRAFQLRRKVVNFPYKGKQPIKDIINPLIDYINDELAERLLFKNLYELFSVGLLSNKDAVAASREVEDESIYFDFSETMKLLDEEDQEIFSALTSELELYQFFFDWQGSVDALVTKLHRFASDVYTGEVVLGQHEKVNEEKKLAPRKAVAADKADDKTGDEIASVSENAEIKEPVKETVPSE
jgi:hypothetical protein